MTDILQCTRTRVIHQSDDSTIEIEFAIKASTSDRNSLANQQIQDCNFSGLLDPLEEMLTDLLCDAVCKEDLDTEEEEIDLDMEDEE